MCMVRVCTVCVYAHRVCTCHIVHVIVPQLCLLTLWLGYLAWPVTELTSPLLLCSLLPSFPWRGPKAGIAYKLSLCLHSLLALDLSRAHTLLLSILRPWRHRSLGPEDHHKQDISLVRQLRTGSMWLGLIFPPLCPWVSLGISILGTGSQDSGGCFGYPQPAAQASPSPSVNREADSGAQPYGRLPTTSLLVGSSSLSASLQHPVQNYVSSTPPCSLPSLPTYISSPSPSPSPVQGTAQWRLSVRV